MKRFSEKDCVNFMKKILSAVQYLHEKISYTEILNGKHFVKTTYCF